MMKQFSNHKNNMLYKEYCNLKIKQGVKMLKKSIVAVFCSLMLTATATYNAEAVSFKNKTVKVIVPSGSGGTYHVYCQIVQRNIGRHIPGKPKTIIQNMSGAGGVKSANYMYHVAPKDGSVLAMLNPGASMVPLLRKGQKAIRFKTRDLNWLGTASVRTYTIAFWHKSPIKTVEDLTKKQAIMVTTGRSSMSYLIPHFINSVVGTKMKIITGYKGGGALNLAIERGEGEGRGNFYSGFTGVRPDWIKDKKIRFILKLGPDRPEVKHVTHLRSLMKTDLEREMFDLLDINLQVGQSFFLPPGVPKKIVKTMRKAFVNMANDPITIADAKKRRVPWKTRTAEQITAQLDKGWKTSPKAINKLRQVLGFDKALKMKKKKKKKK